MSQVKSSISLFMAIWFIGCGVLAGLLNSVVGSGAGLILIVLLNLAGLPTRQVHSTALCVAAVLSMVSYTIYVSTGYIGTSDVYFIILPAILGGILGGFIIQKLPQEYLKLIFSVLLISGGIISLAR